MGQVIDYHAAAGETPTGKIPFEELKRRTQALVPTLRARTAQVESDRRVSADSIQMMRDADLFRLMMPARFGGFEYGFAEFIDIVVELGRGCASSAWCGGLGIVHNWLIAQFPLEAQEEVWADRTNILAGSYAPIVRAERVDGGYRIAGRFPFASGCDNAQWYLIGALLPPEEDGGRPTPSFLLVPRAHTEILDDWHTVGLAGTGSKSIVIKEPTFVPKHRRLTFAEASSNHPPGTNALTNPMYRIPFLASVPVCLVSPAIGTLLSAVDEYLEWAGPRTTHGAVVGAGNAMREYAQVQARIAEGAAAADCAKLLLQRDVRDVEDELRAGGFISVAKRMRNRRDHAYATRLCVQGVTALFEGVGGAGLHMSSGIQRAWRDVHAVARHVSLNWDAVSTMYGQFQFGLEPKGQY